MRSGEREAANAVFSFESISILVRLLECNQPLNLKRSWTNISQTFRFPDDDPALLFVWNLDALIEFVELANAVNPANRRNPAPPAWFATIPPNITAVTLTNDIVARVAPYAGGRCENVMLAPNTLIQYGNVIGALKEVELHPFIQHCMRRLPAGVFLARTYVLTVSQHGLNTVSFI
jgi:hypothetical protein